MTEQLKTCDCTRPFHDCDESAGCRLVQKLTRAQPAQAVNMTEREQFEAALSANPEARFWNTTDAMFWAWQAARAQPAQAVPPGYVLVPVEQFNACKKAFDGYSQAPADYHRAVLKMKAAFGNLIDAAMAQGEKP